MHDCHINKTLVERGLRRTSDRHRLMKLFEQPRAWTVSELARRMRGVTLSTVYRNIHALQRSGLIGMVTQDDQQSRFESIGRPHHDHLSCARCGGLFCVPCPIPRLATHTLRITGFCEACAGSTITY